MKVPKAELDWWLEQERQERLPATPVSPAPAQQQHPRNPNTRMEDNEDGSANTD